MMIAYELQATIEQIALLTWQGKMGNVVAQQALLKQLRLNAAAQRGEYLPAMESAN
jgi:hypothetical protein